MKRSWKVSLIFFGLAVMFTVGFLSYPLVIGNELASYYTLTNAPCSEVNYIIYQNGSTYYALTVYVRYENGTAMSDIDVELSVPGYSRTVKTNINGEVVFRNLIDYTYTVKVLNQTKTVEVPFFDSITFTFRASNTSPNNWITQNWLPLMIVGCSVIAAVIVSRKK